MRSMQVDIVGGGPGGLFLARLLKLADPSMTVRVHERNGPATATGFGLVFSDRTMASLREADPHTYRLLERSCVRWTDMEVRRPDTVLRYGGYGFTAVPRHTLLRLLARQATRAGAELRFHSDFRVPPPEPARHDRVVVIADGAGSANRDRYAEHFGTTVDTGTARYIWFGTEATFDAVTFPFVPTGYGAFAAHAYPYGNGRSTFIVEVDESTWRNAGLDLATTESRRTGRTDRYSQRLLTEVFAAHLDGRPLIGNRSRWAQFRVVRNRRWSVGNLVLLGDAAHTAHFSVGSGTKLAMADAVALATALVETDQLPDAFTAYETARRAPVARTQDLAERSMRWWESFGRRLHLPPHQFGLHFLTRTPAISYAGLRRRHGDRIAEAEAEFARLSPRSWPADSPQPGSALTQPVALGRLRLAHRVAARLPGRPDRQPDLAAGYADRYALLLTDWRGKPPAAVTRLATRWHGPAGRLEDQGVALGVLLEPDAVADAFGQAVGVAGARLLEVSMDLGTDEPVRRPPVPDMLSLTVPVAATFRCPATPAWSPLGDQVVRRCVVLHRWGLAGVHLSAPPGVPWEHLLDWADRIRTESALPVLLDGPSGWRPGLRPPEGVAEDWSSRLHTAVVSGRADLVVAGPSDQSTRTSGT